jgi:hypothetical protein
MIIKDFLILELKLIARNIRPKVLLCFSVMIFAIIRSPPTIEDGYILKSFLLTFVTSSFATYANFWITWDSAYFSLLMSLPNSIKPYIEAKFWMNFVFVSFMMLIFLPFSYIHGFTLYLIAGFLYNSSLSAYIMLYSALYNTEKLNLWKSEILFEGIVDTQYLGAFIYFCLPIILIIGCHYLFSPKIAIIIFSILGLFFLLLYNFILNLLIKKFIKRKKILLESYNTQ